MIRYRIFFALSVALLGMLLGFWLYTGGGLRILKKNLIEERAGVLLTLALEVEASDTPRLWARRFSRNSDINLHLTKKLPGKAKKNIDQMLIRDDRKIYVMAGPRTPMAIKVDVANRQWMIARFPADLDTPRRRIALGLIVIASCAGFAAWGLSRWSIKPLETAEAGMLRIAEGDLSHRLSGSVGPAGESFNRMAERLQGMIEGQRNFIAAISHELRTPLARLRLQTELLSESGVTEVRLNSINEDLHELDDLVEALLSSARFDQGAISHNPEELIFSETLEYALSKVGIEPRELSREFDHGQTIFVDPRLFHRVLVNLLSNIVRYVPTDGKVRISARRDNGFDVISISDNGPGVPESLLPHLFDPFVRADESRNKASGGLGLGLMLVRQVVELHQGRVNARNNEESGLEVQIFLPVPVLI